MTKKMSLLLTGMLLCLAPDIKGNETDGRIKGIVMDGELGGPLEFVTVQVKAKGSDKILQGAVTGSDGNYSIGGLKKGEYIVTYSYIGYAEISKNITISNNSQTLNLGELTLEEDSSSIEKFSTQHKISHPKGDRPVICLPISHPWKSITKDLFHCVEIPA